MVVGTLQAGSVCYTHTHTHTHTHSQNWGCGADLETTLNPSANQ